MWIRKKQYSSNGDPRRKNEKNMSETIVKGSLTGKFPIFKM
jgi:hypothetical protein